MHKWGYAVTADGNNRAEQESVGLCVGECEARNLQGRAIVATEIGLETQQPGEVKLSRDFPARIPSLYGAARDGGERRSGGIGGALGIGMEIREPAEKLCFGVVLGSGKAAAHHCHHRDEQNLAHSFLPAAGTSGLGLVPLSPVRSKPGESKPTPA